MTLNSCHLLLSFVIMALDKRLERLHQEHFEHGVRDIQKKRGGGVMRRVGTS